MVLLCARLGLRPGEVLSLTVKTFGALLASPAVNAEPCGKFWRG